MFWLRRLNPANKFKEFFELVQAYSPELKDEVYRLRHRVFSDELGFERPNYDGREHDEFDLQSRHLLLRSVKTGISIGTVRLVMVPPEGPRLLLPFEKILAATIDRREFYPVALPRSTIAEISRLTLAREFRRHRRVEASGTAAPRAFGTPAHPTFPYVQLGLYLGAIALAEQLGIETLFLLTEPRLLAHFRRLGFRVRQIGAPIEHRGVRVLSMADVAEGIAHLPFFMRPLFRVIALEIDESRETTPSKRYTVPRPARLTGQIGPGRAGARPAFHRRVKGHLVGHSSQGREGERESAPDTPR
jgi:N-acyl amino acid synthase of PEP-CTERM/exosortase system